MWNVRKHMDVWKMYFLIISLYWIIQSCYATSERLHYAQTRSGCVRIIFRACWSISTVIVKLFCQILPVNVDCLVLKYLSGITCLVFNITINKPYGNIWKFILHQWSIKFIFYIMFFFFSVVLILNNLVLYFQYYYTKTDSPFLKWTPTCVWYIALWCSDIIHDTRLIAKLIEENCNVLYFHILHH